jgi:phenylalanyl-tRNA synthetase beta chain
MKIPLQWLKEYIDLPSDLKVFTDKMSMIGHMLDKTIVTDTDTVIDLELRGNRADCYGILGIAREAHASFGGRLSIPNVGKLPDSSGLENFTVSVQSDAVHRFHSIIIRGVQIGPSPEWLQTRLKNYGMEPINNVVDITNYVMIESGMPLHAFDLNRIKGNRLILRAANQNEKFTSFDGAELTLRPEDVVFANELGDVLGLVGIVGEKNSGIQDDTVDILLECAAYDQSTIRKTVYTHNIITEAGIRHAHDLDASLCDYALARAVTLITELANGGSLSLHGRDDYHPHPRTATIIHFNTTEVRRLGGVTIPVEEQAEILRRLECQVDVQGETLHITVPLFRTDLKASEDIVEEILRIYGYEKIPIRTLASAIPLPVEQKEVQIEEQSRDILSALGLDEIITVPFYHGDMLDKMKDPHKDRAIAIMNPPTSLHTHMRTTMFVEHLKVAHKVQARGDEEMAFYEVGKIYLRKDDHEDQPPHKPEFPYLEQRVITAVFSSKPGNAHTWDYYHVKGVLEQYFEGLGVQNIVFTKQKTFPYRISAVVTQNGRELATIGLINPVISKSMFHLPYDVYGFVIDIDALAQATFTAVDYMPYSAYPAVSLDMSVRIPVTVQAGDILQVIKKTGGDLLRDLKISNVYEKGDGKRSLLIRCVYQSKERNLTIEETHTRHQEIARAIEQQFGATIAGNK